MFFCWTFKKSHRTLTLPKVTWWLWWSETKVKQNKKVLESYPKLPNQNPNYVFSNTLLLRSLMVHHDAWSPLLQQAINPNYFLGVFGGRAETALWEIILLTAIFVIAKIGSNLLRNMKMIWCVVNTSILWSRPGCIVIGMGKRMFKLCCYFGGKGEAS